MTRFLVSIPRSRIRRASSGVNLSLGVVYRHMTDGDTRPMATPASTRASKRPADLTRPIVEHSVVDLLCEVFADHGLREGELLVHRLAEEDV